jgi:hypothetical protein
MRRTRLRGKISLLFVAFAALLAVPAIALADDIANNLDPTIDAVAEQMPLTAGGANGTTQLYVTPRNGDGKNGCNLTGSTSLVLSVSSSNTSVATVSPSSITFGSCGDLKTLTVTPVSQGSATISVSQTSNNTGGTFNLAPATFTVNVAPPPNTPPQVSVQGVTGGASYNKGSVPTATCSVTDAEDGNSSFAATLSVITGPYASDGIGQQTASCSYTDAAGATAVASETFSIVDPSPPVIGYTLNPATPDGDNSWYKSNVSLTWNVSEPQSPNSLSKTGCVDQNITADQAATTYSCSATSAGGSASPVEVTIKRDGTAPVITLGSVSGTAGTNGWYKSAVTQTFNASDATSGVAGPTTIPVSSGAAEGDDVMIASGAVSDNAGNSNPGINAGPFKVDLSDPTNVAFVGGPAAGGSYDFGDVPGAPTCTAQDAVSGLKNCVVSGYSNAVGNHTLTATATDNAGRTATKTLTYTVLAWRLSGFYSPVDMNDVVNTVKNGSTVPLKFEVFKASGPELTDTGIVKQPLTAKQVSCTAFNGDPVDEIELLATGGTTLRYDTTGGQFIYNWQTPKGASQVGKCFTVSAGTQDGSSIPIASFKLK